MHYKKILLELKKVEKDYKNLNKELKSNKILKSKLNSYIKEDKDSFIVLWKKYIVLFTRLKRLIRKSNYRSFIFLKNYNKLVLRKYILVFYYNCIVEIMNNFGKHEAFLRIFLGENFKKDYGTFAKYIYRPSFISIINTPNLFIKPMKRFINKDVYKLLKGKKMDIRINNRMSSDYYNLYFYIKNRVDKLLFIISKYVGKVISLTRFSPRTKGLITKENLDKYLCFSKPGDILLTRGNWNASNLSIPGFWKHMSMYIGKGFFLKENFSNKNFKKLDNNKDYIIEATGKGIEVLEIDNLTSHNDYLGVSRTKFSKEKIHRVLKNSFNHIGKGYDHRFNFYSDESLVCSELVLKSYSKEFEGDDGISIKLENIGISLTYPPNNFIELLKNNKKDIEPIFFIDSYGKTGENFISTTDKLLKSGKRSRSSLFLK